MQASSLSVLLPLHNAQALLPRLVAGLLETLAETTQRWDVWVIDDGSNDATCEIAHELVRSYPQIHLVSHPAQLGFEECLRTGLSQARGDYVLVRDDGCDIDPHAVDRLWRVREEANVVVAHPVAQAALGWLPRLPGMSAAEDEEPTPTWRLIERRFLDGWRIAGNGRTLDEYLERHGASRRAVEVRHDKATVWAPARGKRRPSISLPLRQRENAPAGVRRPNYLDKLKQFALGE